jgi:uncharacterized protein YdhG (YjbR/CyaY superfamily)
MNEVDDYLAKVPSPQKEMLLKIRHTVTAQVPEARESISYGMPAFKLDGKYLVGYAAFKDHLSLFPGSRPVEVLKEELKDFKTSKGTIQFSADKPVGEELLTRIISICLEVAQNTR